MKRVAYIVFSLFVATTLICCDQIKQRTNSNKTEGAKLDTSLAPSVYNNGEEEKAPAGAQQQGLSEEAAENTIADHSGQPDTYQKKSSGAVNNDHLKDGQVKYKITGGKDVFYVGIENELELTLSGFKYDGREVTISPGSISQKNYKTYLIEVDTPGTIATLKVFIKKDNAKKLVSTKAFEVKRLPAPRPMLGRLKPGAVRADIFKAQMGLTATFNFSYEVRYKVKGFTMVYIPVGKEPVSETSESAVFSEKMKALKLQAKPGDVYRFTDIKAIGQGGFEHDLETISYEIL